MFWMDDVEMLSPMEYVQKFGKIPLMLKHQEKEDIAALMAVSQHKHLLVKWHASSLEKD